MNVNYKLKVRSQKQQVVNRRIRTQANENPKKISFYLSKPIKQPLLQNKRILNQTQSKQPLSIASQLKRVKPIKSIVTKGISSSKVGTQFYEKSSIIPLNQKAAIERMFPMGHKRQASSNLPNHIDTKINKTNQQVKKVIRGETKAQSRIDNKIQTKIQYKERLEYKLQGQARYQCQDKVGAGTFGVVYKARDRKTLDIVAIKKVFQDKKYKNRQLEILKLLNHPNVLKMRDCFYTFESDKQYLNVVMDYFSRNLYQQIQSYRPKSQFPLLKLKAYSYQMLRSLLYLSSLSIAHRDIKPQNILCSPSTLNLILCDFGSAKQLVPTQPNISYICSRCYRAPELIFGNSRYDTQIDMWSVGCVIVQMVTGEPVFRADSNIDQLVEIIKVLGTPTTQEMLEMNRECDFQKFKLPKIAPKSWEKILRRKNLGQEFFDLVKKILRYSPLKRITPYQALLHPFFDQLKQEDIYYHLKKEYKIPNLFDFKVTKQVEQSKVSKLIPDWYKQ